ncbi:MAG: hypothetical protein GX815_07285 [Clostridiales bacterium]|nr:hypothetical protein [Clostridiales bacterium]
MINPDLVGLTPKEARQVLAQRFPEIKYRCKTFHSPQLRNREGTSKVAYLVIRQKIIGENTLQLIISPFSMVNE